MFFKLLFSVKENIREINFAIAIISSIVCIDIISFLTFRLHHGNVILPHNPPFHIGAEVQFECLPGNSIIRVVYPELCIEKHDLKNISF